MNFDFILRNEIIFFTFFVSKLLFTIVANIKKKNSIFKYSKSMFCSDFNTFFFKNFNTQEFVFCEFSIIA